MIAKYNSNNREFGYNNSSGGERNFTFNHTEESKDKISKANSKAVLQLDIVSNEVIAKYNSVKCASLATNINRVSIQYVCNGKRKTAGGYRWQYEDKPTEYNPEYTRLMNIKCGKYAKKHTKIKHTKKVGMFNKETGRLLMIFDSVRSAYESTGIKEKQIYNVCNNCKKSAGGYVWKYIEN